MDEMQFLAHISDDGRKQTVSEHLKGTAALCGKFAASFGAEKEGYFAGTLHDIGKFSFAFQKRLAGGEKVDHSTAGAFEAMKLNQLPASFSIAGHHAGLPDGGGQTDITGTTLHARLNKAMKNTIEDYSRWRNEIKLPEIPSLPNLKDPAEAAFYIRMLYSCLVDADYLDTERFMTGRSRPDTTADFEALNNSLDAYIAPWFPPKNQLNTKRCEILSKCLYEGANSKKGIYTLTVPTGGGKTVASLAFALRHARHQKMERIIYVIPYTSIIEQTAEIFRNIVGEKNVLEHHSGVLFDMGESETADEIKKAQATENWDMSVIVTTAVQFFESLYAARSSKCRKLHNIANSVIIFDEAQMMPIPYLTPCVFAISQLVKYFKCTAVLCTATQPALNAIFEEYLPETDIRELCPDALFSDELFRRTVFRKAGKLSWEQIANQLNETEQVLCIVNSRKNAQKVYEQLTGEGSFHLSTLMSPLHRKRVLKVIRKRLSAGEPCRVVATSLIEAGVDVDFPAVYREEAGLDSVLQAAGRCNREGKRPAADSVVTVFASENTPPPIFDIPIKAGRLSMAKYADISCKEAVNCYFSDLLSLKGSRALDQKNIMGQLRNDNFPFKTVASQFKLIESDTRTVYIPSEESEALIERLKYGEKSRALYRALAQHSVSIYENHFLSLENAGALQILDDGSAVLTDLSLYSPATGLSLNADSGQALFI